MTAKLSDYPPEEVTIDGETFLQWRIPYRGKTLFATMGTTLERFNSSPFDRQDIQEAINKLVSHD